MANYYEILKLPPNATTVEIEAAINVQYNQWRRLVTHHDPGIVEKANHTLRVLETIRFVLSDPNRRNAYHAEIGLEEQTAGIADPEALLQIFGLTGSMTPPAIMGGHESNSSQEFRISVPSLWSCPKCKTQNPEKSEFCLKCGTRLLRTCPECNKDTSLVSTGICGNCGIQYEVALQKKQIREKIVQLRNALSQEEEKLLTLSDRKKGRRMYRSALFGFLGLGLVFLLLAIGSGGVLWGWVVVVFLVIVFLSWKIIREQNIGAEIPILEHSVAQIRSEIAKQELAISRLDQK